MQKSRPRYSTLLRRERLLTPSYLGVPVDVWGSYQVFTGVFKGARSINQLTDAIHNPTVKETPLRFGEDIVFGLLPNFSGISNFIGGLA